MDKGSLFKLRLAYMNRVATNGNEQYGHVSTTILLSSWLEMNTGSKEAWYSGIFF